MTTNEFPKVNGIADETVKKANLYQVIEDLILSEHARYLTEDCGIDLGTPSKVEDPKDKSIGKNRS